jgi:hypothetical protein
VPQNAINNKTLPAHNTQNHDAHSVEKDYRVRSIPLAARKIGLLIGGKRHCVVLRHDVTNIRSAQGANEFMKNTFHE